MAASEGVQVRGSAGPRECGCCGGVACCARSFGALLDALGEVDGHADDVAFFGQVAPAAGAVMENEAADNDPAYCWCVLPKEGAAEKTESGSSGSVEQTLARIKSERRPGVSRTRTGGALTEVNSLTGGRGIFRQVSRAAGAVMEEKAVETVAANLLRKRDFLRRGIELRKATTEAQLPQATQQGAEAQGAKGAVDGLLHNGAWCAVA